MEEKNGAPEAVGVEVDEQETKDSGKPSTAGNQRRVTMAPALISTSPDGNFVIVAIGAALRVFDLKSNVAILLRDDTTPSRHGDAIRTAAFDRRGKQFVSAGDDKLVKLWDTSDWHCKRSVRVAKKVSAAAFSFDGNWLVFADKYGVLSVLSAESNEGSPVQLLGHCCSIITDLAISPDGRFVASGDRDLKVRVSVFPAKPLLGAHEIQSFCLGHKLFVTCVDFIGGNDTTEGLIVSGGGDCTVRLWEPSTGKELQCVSVFPADKAACEGDEVEAEETVDENRSVMALAVAADNRHVAVAVERFAGVFLLSVTCESKTMQLLQKVLLEEHLPPTSLCFDFKGHLWLATGAVPVLETDDSVVTPKVLAEGEKKANEIASTAPVRITVVVRESTTASQSKVSLSIETLPSSGGLSKVPEETSCSKDGGPEPIQGDDFVLLTDERIPGGDKLLKALQGNIDDEAAVAAMAAEAADLAIKSELCKRSFTQAEREFRKRHRNDKRGLTAAR